MQLPQSAPQRLDFLRVRILLSLGQLHAFQHFFHVVERFFQSLDDLINLFDGLLNRHWSGWLALPPGLKARLWLRFTRLAQA